MNFKLRYVGNLRVPRGVVGQFRRRLDHFGMRNLELRQIHVDDVGLSEMWNLLSASFGADVPPGGEASVLEYRSVGEHDDDWSTVLDSRKNWVAPGFLHVVLSGSCVVRCGRVKRAFKRGDVFLLNPNARHEVPSKTLCMTYTVVVPAHEMLKLCR